MLHRQSFITPYNSQIHCKWGGCFLFSGVGKGGGGGGGGVCVCVCVYVEGCGKGR